MPAGPILKFALQTLREIWKEHKDLKNGEQRELEQLEDDLVLLQAFLKESAERLDKSDLFRAYELRITELVYDVEDTIAICFAKKAAANTKNIVPRFFQNFSINMAKKVKSLRKDKVKPIIDGINRQFEKKVAGKGTRASLQNRPTEGIKVGSSGQSFVTIIEKESISESTSKRPPNKKDKSLEMEIVESSSQGQLYEQDKSEELEIGESSSQGQLYKQDKSAKFKDEETIIGYLKGDEHDVICITGRPGIGKTTLAMNVFQHSSIVNDFRLLIWIHVSQRFNKTDVFLHILQRLAPKPLYEFPSNKDLIKAVAECLKKKRVLIVVDDLWTVEDWNVIKQVFPMDNWQGKVLVTSREKGIKCGHSHELKGLGSKASLELLKWNVFGLDKCHFDLEVVLQAIANNCRGVPQTIVMIGGILKDMMEPESIIGTKDKWLKVLENVQAEIKEDPNKSISNTIQLSYDRLGDELRVCFLYTGLFPMNQEIAASTLTKLWIAEGFIRCNDTESIEETATKVLDDLIGKNLLMVSKKHLGQVKTCRVHDNIHEFCKAKAAEDNFFNVMKASTGGDFVPRVSDIRRFRRLGLHANPSRFLSANPSGPHVRSFLCFVEEDLDLDPSRISTIPNAFNLLRILDCKSIKFSAFPEFKRLILLKHITISFDNLNVLPKRISKLLNLETLIVDTKSRSITVEANIWKMTRLRRFETKASISLYSSKKEESRVCEDLETMTRLSPESCTATLSRRAPKLKTLGIQGKLDKLFDTFPLPEFRRLEKLKIVNDVVGESASDNPLIFLPQLGRFPPRLNRLTLSRTYLVWNTHMPILASINTLKILKLKDNAFTGKSWSAEVAGFTELQFLLVENIQDLLYWNASSAHFPKLRWLVIKRCHNIQNVPDSVAAKLEKLEIEHVNSVLVESAKEIAAAKAQAAKEQVEQNQKSPFSVRFKLTIGSGCNY